LSFLIDPNRLVFIDETWTKTNMTLLCGWAGQRLVDKVPRGHRKTETFVAASPQQPHRRALRVRWPINGERFKAYVEPFLVPTLNPGDFVIPDNFAHTKAVGRAMRDVGVRLVKAAILRQVSIALAV
jgi:hypothetical protein